MGAGRPQQYDRKATMQTICNLIARKQTMTTITQIEGMPSYEAVRTWTLEDPELAAMYARAREFRADARADKIDEITIMVIEGKLDPSAARVVIDAEKWQAGKEMPKRYGDRITQEVVGDPEKPLEIVQRPQISREEWLNIHGMDTAVRASTSSD